MIAPHVGKLAATSETNGGLDHTEMMDQDTSDNRRSALNRL